MYPDTDSVLAEVQRMGIKQVILSASQMSNLETQISSFDIIDYFDDLLGLTDIYANSKVDIGKKYISQNEIRKAVLIGDSRHDFEVAQEMFIDCLLISNGHQSKEALLSCGVPVLYNIVHVPSFLLAEE